MNKKSLGLWLVFNVAVIYVTLSYLTTGGIIVNRALAQPSDDWDVYFEATGINEILAQSDFLIEQEVRNLSKTPLGFSSNQLQRIGENFRQRLSPQRLKADMVTRLNQSFSLEDKHSLSQLLDTAFLKQLQSLEIALQNENVRQSMRAYQMKLKTSSPNVARIELLAALDDSLQQSSLETELKVELRKQLLAVVSKIKSDETISEHLLDQQMSEYRTNVEGEISENALHAYLYLLKQIPSSQLRDWLSALNDPVYGQFMAVCQDSLRASFRHARQEMLSDSRVAGG